MVLGPIQQAKYGFRQPENTHFSIFGQGWLLSGGAYGSDITATNEAKYLGYITWYMHPVVAYQ